MTAAPPVAIALEAGSNLRDLGGWPAADGRHVRTGLLFRGPALAGLTAPDLATVAALSLDAVVDFRSPDEQAARPARLPCRRLVSLPVETTVVAELRDIARRGALTGEDADRLMRQAYAGLATEVDATWRALFALLRDPATGPVLFHCSAGKDRTGVAAALVLGALGVSRGDVMRDYLATNRDWRREGIADRAHGPEWGDPTAVPDSLLRASPALLDHAIDTLERAHGSLDRYLETALGLAPPDLAALRDRLLA